MVKRRLKNGYSATVCRKLVLTGDGFEYWFIQRGDDALVYIQIKKSNGLLIDLNAFFDPDNLEDGRGYPIPSSNMRTEEWSTHFQRALALFKEWGAENFKALKMEERYFHFYEVVEEVSVQEALAE